MFDDLCVIFSLDFDDSCITLSLKLDNLWVMFDIDFDDSFIISGMDFALDDSCVGLGLQSIDCRFGSRRFRFQSNGLRLEWIDCSLFR